MTNDRMQPADAIQCALATPPHGRVLIIGAADTGKTTLAARLVAALAAAGRLPVAVVDGDIGQSEIGPPGVVGLGIYSSQDAEAPGTPELRGLNRIPMQAGAFVGSTTPQGHSLATASAIIQMAQTAALLTPRPSCTLIDTPGFITGTSAALIRMLIEVVRPHLVIALERDAELEAILRPWESVALSGSAAGSNATRICRQKVAPEVGRKSAQVRATRRAARFAQHLSGARLLNLDWNSAGINPATHTVVLEKTWLSYGEPLPPHEMQFLTRTLGASCLHAERLAEGQLKVIVGGQLPLFRHPPKSGSGPLAALEQTLRVKSVALESLDDYDGLLCGLRNAPGELLGIGLIGKIDFLRRTLTVLTPIRSEGAVARVEFGAIRLRPDGREMPQTPGR